MMATRRSRPVNCIEQNPTTHTVRLREVPIVLSTVAKLTGIHTSHISRVFMGKRRFSIEQAQDVADALGMGLEDLISALKERNALPKAS